MKEKSVVFFIILYCFFAFSPYSSAQEQHLEVAKATSNKFIENIATDQLNSALILIHGLLRMQGTDEDFIAELSTFSDRFKKIRSISLFKETYTFGDGIMSEGHYYEVIHEVIVSTGGFHYIQIELFNTADETVPKVIGVKYVEDRANLNNMEVANTIANKFIENIAMDNLKEALALIHGSLRMQGSDETFMAELTVFRDPFKKIRSIRLFKEDYTFGDGAMSEGHYYEIIHEVVISTGDLHYIKTELFNAVEEKNPQVIGIKYMENKADLE
ncbi:MAG: hypothetical protein JJT94_10575 [Bernardetiaceae bacterium]|nr:hypothetical protein [Bernardetiaceae bacterium]